MVDLQDITFQYNQSPEPALKNINLKIGEGEFVLVSGPSGSGKSSLCRVMNGLVPHFYGGSICGKAEVAGLRPMEVTTDKMATRVGMVFQDPENQLVTSDVEHEICFGMENLALPVGLISKRLEEALDTLGISHLRRRPINELSGGEKQKTAIASVLALHPQVLILDEPTSELDPKGAEDVLSMLCRLNSELGLTVVLVEHRLDRVIQHAERILLLSDGRIVLDGPARQVMTRQTAFIAQSGIGLPPLVELSRRVSPVKNAAEVPFNVKEARKVLGQEIMKARKPPISVGWKARASSPVIQMKNIDYYYPSGLKALSDINLEVSEGEMLAVMGRNASGKTTLVKQINGLLKPSRGKILIFGQDVSGVSVAQRSARVGMVFQNPEEGFFADTVEEEIAFGLKNNGTSNAEVKRRVERMLEDFGLTGYRHKFPRSLGSGEKQRLALASVIAPGPGILVLDEPTRGVEERLKMELMEFLSNYRKEGKTVILVTHDIELIARFGDRIVLMSEGRIVVDGDKHEVMSHALMFSPQVNRLVQSFVRHGVPGNLLTVDEIMESMS